MRKYYIDNIRSLCVLLLFPFHSAYIFNNLNEAFYVNGAPSEALTAVDLFIYPWWMTGLFVLAGLSARYALQIFFIMDISEVILSITVFFST